MGSGATRGRGWSRLIQAMQRSVDGRRQRFRTSLAGKAAGSLDRIAGEEIGRQVMQGSEGLSSGSRPQEAIDWPRRAMERLDSVLDEQRKRAVMTACACQYPKPALQAARQEYQGTKNVDRVLQILQQQFDSFLQENLRLSRDLISEIASRGWGLTGVRQGSSIIATKIPRSGYLIEYMQETDPARRRQLYCHCPRIRMVLESSQTSSSTYCYCGAGFYQGISEEILQEPVEVEALETVLQGHDVCVFAVRLPAG